MRPATTGAILSTSTATPCLVRMEAIGLVEFRFHRHTFEKEWIERQMMGARKLGEDRVESTFVLVSPIRRSEHPEKQYFRAGSLDLVDHLVEIITHGYGIDAP